jgi:hypothetical protein
MGYAIEEEASVESNLNKLAAGRISAYADLESIVDHTLGKDTTRYKNNFIHRSVKRSIIC